MCDQETPNTVDATKNSNSDNTNPQDSSTSIHQNDSLIEPHSDSTDNQEATDNDKQCDDFDQSSNISRELKSLLALSKEANLKTNISHKRKKEAARSFSLEADSKKSVKLASENKHFKFPVTAEAELDELPEQENKFQNETLKIFKRKRNSLSENSGSAADSEEFGKRNKKAREYKVFKPNKDIFCWRCHREGVNIACETCPRSYHQKCLKQTITDASHWPCPECVAILKAESTQTRSPAMKGMTLEHLCSLLKFAVNRMIQCHGSEPFLHPVNIKEFPEYKKYIIEPMDLTMLEKNIKDNIYGSTQAFEADAKWLLHNSIIFNSYQSKLTSSAKTMIKICKQEMMEIENCPSCYLKANTNKSTWFVEVCPKPHILVWAKLKGFPYWPAKAMSINSSGMVDVRFFGAHDRAWVHYKDCYLYSEKDPNTFKQKRFDIEKCVEELNFYIENLKKIYGEFRYAPFRTLLDSEDIYKQLVIFLPKYKSVQARRRSTVDSIEAKSDEQAYSKSGPNEEISEDPEKSEASSRSNLTTPIQDNDTTMEGYGTDDDMPSEIDHESRKAFAEKKESNSDDKTEDEDDEDDTQIPANVSVDGTLPRGKVRTRGGFNHAIGKLKVLPRMSSENRMSDDLSSPAQKKSRRNSDQSVKSDSSRISNVSDKINRVSISENMEITLGNEDVGYVSISENISSLNGENSQPGSENSYDIKKKPVQVVIENAEFSISPNKVKISDKLIKKLSDDHRTEGVKKSLKDVESRDKKNEPSSLSTKQTKLNVNGEVESSLDEDTFIQNKKLDYDTKAKTIQPSITEYMTVVPKMIDVISESQPSSSNEKVSEKNSNSISELITENMDVELTASEAVKPENVLKKTSEVLPKESTEQCSVLETNKQVSVPNDTEKDLVETLIPKDVQKMLSSEKKKDTEQLKVNLVETLISKNVQEILGSEKKKDNEQFKVNLGETLVPKNVQEVLGSEKKKDTEQLKVTLVETSIPKNVQEILGSEKKKDNEQLKLVQVTSPAGEISGSGLDKVIDNVVPMEIATQESVTSPSKSIDDTNIDKKIESLSKNKNIIVLSENKTDSNSISHKLKRLEQEITFSKIKPVSVQSTEKKVGNKESSIQGTEKEVVNKDSSMQGSEKIVENIESSLVTEKAVKNKESSIIGPSTSKDASCKNANKDSVVDIIDEFNEEEEEEEDMATIENMVNLVYDKKNIFDVIHSSLKTGDVDKSTNVLNKKKETNRPFRFVTDTDSSKKRKLNADETPSPAKIVKLVSIESILKKKDKDDVEKRIMEKSDAAAEHLLTPEDIKSEPESEDEPMLHSSKMEEKRKYLNALNIYERSAENERKEKNEIRTRSKAEEKRERFKVVDNLTRIIDDVAMNYSAQHEGEIIPQRKVERRKSTGGALTHEGEIYVKSFAKIPAPPCGKQRARKTFPIPYYIKQTVKTPIMPRRDISVLRKDQPPQKVLNTSGTVRQVVSTASNTYAKAVGSSTVTTVSPSGSSTPVSEAPQASTSLAQPSFGVVTSSSSSMGLLPTTSSGGSCLMSQTAANPHTMAMGHVILMSGPSVNYCQPINNPGLNVVSHPAASLTTSSLNSQTQLSVLKNTLQPPNVRTSQNYIPHGDSDSSESSSPVSATNHSNNSLNESSNQKSQDTSNIPVTPTNNSNNNSNPMEQSPPTSTNTSNSSNNNNNPPPPPMAAIEQEDEFAVLNGLVPESVSRAVSELLLRPPPRLKPRPPGVTSQNFDEGMPSTAGDVTNKINSIAHRMTDYFRGMLIETLEDIGKTTTPEAKITSLQLEIESLKHTHNLEMAEMRKNVCTILKDIQRSIVEERDKIVDETRAACENETIRRVELAKSKQWCANCPKEAQFYCCWNTSYCDYPCQQKHWPHHAGKCTQSIEKATGTGPVPPPRTGVQPIVLRPALTAPKPMGRIIAKPAKVYMNKANAPQKPVKTVPTSGLTLVETTPGNYELVGNGSIGLAGKIFTTSAATLASSKYKVLTSSAGTSPRPSDPTRQASSSGTKSQYII